MSSMVIAGNKLLTFASVHVVRILHVGKFSGVLIFVKSQRRPSEFNFMVLNFVTATQSRGVMM